MRLAYLFIHDWTHEFAAYENGAVPRHRLFGASDLTDRGHVVETCGGACSRLPWRFRQAWWVISRQRRLDAVVATHEAAALPVLVLRRLGLLRRPVLVFTVAATDGAKNAGWRGRARRWALRGADHLSVYARSQQGQLAGLLGLPVDRVSFLPLGVDVDYFAPRGLPRERSVLSVGTNEGKDFATLVRALPDDVPCTIVSDPANLEQARRAANGRHLDLRRDVPIAELRDLYATAGVLVIPLRDADLSSGQTVLAENHAMGTPLVVTDVPAVRDYAPAAVRVPAGDSDALREAITTALDGPTRRRPQPGSVGPGTGPVSSAATAVQVERLLEELRRG